MLGFFAYKVLWHYSGRHSFTCLVVLVYSLLAKRNAKGDRRIISTSMTPPLGLKILHALIRKGSPNICVCINSNIYSSFSY